MPKIQLPELRLLRVIAVEAEERLLLINRHPGPDETDVPLNATVALEIADMGTDGVDRSATRVWVSGTLAFDVDLLPGFDGPRSQVTQSADSLCLVLDPAIPFESQAFTEIRVQSATVGQAHSIDEIYAFVVEDRTAPKVVAAQAVEPCTVRIAFDENVEVTDPPGFSFEPLDLPAVPLIAESASSQDNVVQISLSTEMTPDVRYLVTVSGVADTNGNPALSPFDTAQFNGFRPAVPGNRRFDLWQMVPKHNRRADTTGDLLRFIKCLQEVTYLLLADVDRFPNIFDLERSPEPFLDLILQDLGNPFFFDLDDLGKRRLASILVELYRQKGTAPGIKNAIRFFLGIEVEIAAFTADTMSLGESELGVDWILGPSGRFALYAFNVTVDQTLTDDQRKQIRALINLIKPAHTHFNLLEPQVTPVLDRWVLGLSTLGESSILM